jgi:hypothetical protein
MGEGDLVSVVVEMRIRLGGTVIGVHEVEEIARAYPFEEGALLAMVSLFQPMWGTFMNP